MTEKEYDLGQAELEVLKALWELGRAPVRQVMNHLHANGRKVAYTTVLTFLTRLEQKGFVAADKSELAYVYRARISRERIMRSRLKSLLAQLYDGAAGQLALQLIRSERLTAEEVAELHKLIDRLDTKGRKTKRKGT